MRTLVYDFETYYAPKYTLSTLSTRSAPQCSACNRVAVQKKRAEPGSVVNFSVGIPPDDQDQSGRGWVVVRGSADAGDQANPTLPCVLGVAGREKNALRPATSVSALWHYLWPRRERGSGAVALAGKEIGR